MQFKKNNLVRHKIKKCGLRKWNNKSKFIRGVTKWPLDGESDDCQLEVTIRSGWTSLQIFLPVLDPNVDVIFVSPVPLSEETLQYYSKLLGLKSAIDSGNVEDQGEFNERYKIIVPEAIKSFPVSLSFVEKIYF